MELNMGMNIAAQRRTDEATVAPSADVDEIDVTTPASATPAKRARLNHTPSSIESDISFESSMARSMEARTELAQQKLQHKMTIETREQELKERELRLKEMQLEFEMKQWEAKQK